MKCRNCLSINLNKIVKIGYQPISSIFYKKKKFKLKKYPLDLYKCVKCDLVQLSQNAPLEKMYGKNYGYKTSISKLMVDHLKKKFNDVEKNFSKKKISVLDIGSNDGTFLNFFPNKNFLVGIDPSAKKFKNLYKKNINLINNFFSRNRIIDYFKKKDLKFDLITSFAIFYDIQKPQIFCSEIFQLLNKNGIWVVEFSYLPLMLKNLTYDQICHEHVTYYSLTVFKKIIERNNLKIIDIKLNEINGGSIEIKCARIDSKFKISKNKISKFIQDEKNINENTYKKFNKRVSSTIIRIKKFLTSNKKQVVGYGASTKGNIVLNLGNISEHILKFICDENKEKLDHYTPGSNIKIISKKLIPILKPKYLFVLIWSFRQEVIKEQMQFIKEGGKLVFHLPRFHIVNKNNYKNFYNNSFKKLSYKY
jgi:NDP-4-keto-2,6-dideoxyhexose 3-C-methyltransferase